MYYTPIAVRVKSYQAIKCHRLEVTSVTSVIFYVGVGFVATAFSRWRLTSDLSRHYEPPTV
jgi:hypothetical protein